MHFGPTITTRFERVKLYAVKSLPCPVCGKRVRREKTFEKTVNPFNTNEDGSVKTRREVRKSMYPEIAQWRLEPEAHRKCQEVKVPVLR